MNDHGARPSQEVAVVVDTGADVVSFSVVDHGIGSAETDRDRILESFLQQSSGAPDVARGTPATSRAPRAPVEARRCCVCSSDTDLLDRAPWCRVHRDAYTQGVVTVVFTAFHQEQGEALDGPEDAMWRYFVFER